MQCVTPIKPNAHCRGGELGVDQVAGAGEIRRIDTRRFDDRFEGL